MEKQDITIISEACLSLKKRLLNSLWDDVSPLLIEVLKFSLHPTEEDAVLELSRSELLFVALLQALRTKNTVMSGRLLLEVEDWQVLPRLSLYFGIKLHVEFDCPNDFFSSAADFAHILNNCGLFKVSKKLLEFLDHLAECMRKEIKGRSSGKQAIGTADHASSPSSSLCASSSHHEMASRTIAPSSSTITTHEAPSCSLADDLQKNTRNIVEEPSGGSIQTRSQRRRKSGMKDPQQEKRAKKELKDETIIPGGLASSLERSSCPYANYQKPFWVVAPSPAVVVSTEPSAWPNAPDAAADELSMALLIAVNNNNIAGVRSALKKGVDVNRGINGFLPLSFAAKTGRAQIARMLLKAGAEVEAMHCISTRALHYAADTGHVGVIDVLLKAGADVEAEVRGGSRPLHFAAMSGKNKAIIRLVQAGADLHARNFDGETPLSETVISFHKSTANLLRSLGARQ